MYGVVCGVHQRERKGEREAPRGDALLPVFFFCKHLQFLPGKQEAASNF